MRASARRRRDLGDGHELEAAVRRRDLFENLRGAALVRVVLVLKDVRLPRVGGLTILGADAEWRGKGEARPLLPRGPARLEVAAAMAWEALVEAHTRQAREFVALFEGTMPLEESMNR